MGNKSNMKNCNNRRLFNGNLILKEDYELIDINIEDKKDREILKSFYTSYKKAFSDDDERETLENIYHYLGKKDKTKNKYHILVIKDKKDILAGAIFDYLSDVASGIVEYIFVVQKHKRKHMGSDLFKKIIEILKEDAKNDNKVLEWVYCEIDDPTTRDPNDRGYIFFWKKQGLKKIDVKYIQPALESNKKTVDKLQIIAKSYDKNKLNIDKKVYENFLYNFFEFCFDLDNIELHIKAQNLENIPSTIKLKEIEVNNLPNN